jgi:tartrate dehydrogenase/decarboxylase / D-malate dehydrogenase
MVPLALRAGSRLCPDITGQGVANPSGTICAASLLLEHANHADAGRCILDALEAAIDGGTRTRDLGSWATTDAMIEAVIRELLRSDRAGR